MEQYGILIIEEKLTQFPIALFNFYSELCRPLSNFIAHVHFTLKVIMINLFYRCYLYYEQTYFFAFSRFMISAENRKYSDSYRHTTFDCSLMIPTGKRNTTTHPHCAVYMVPQYCSS